MNSLISITTAPTNPNDRSETSCSAQFPVKAHAKNAQIDLLKPLEPHVRQTESTNIGAKPAPKFNFQTPLSVENLIARFYPAQARWEGFSSEQQ